MKQVHMLLNKYIVNFNEGLTLVELLIALTIAGFLLVGLLNLSTYDLSEERFTEEQDMATIVYASTLQKFQTIVDKEPLCASALTDDSTNSINGGGQGGTTHTICSLADMSDGNISSIGILRYGTDTSISNNYCTDSGNNTDYKFAIMLHTNPVAPFENNKSGEGVYIKYDKTNHIYNCFIPQTKPVIKNWYQGYIQSKSPSSNQYGITINTNWAPDVLDSVGRQISSTLFFNK